MLECGQSGLGGGKTGRVRGPGACPTGAPASEQVLVERSARRGDTQ